MNCSEAVVARHAGVDVQPGWALGAKEEENEEEKEEEKKEMSGTMVMVHPLSYGGETFLPCVYDYGCTVRRTQNLTLWHGASSPARDCQLVRRDYHGAAVTMTLICGSRQMLLK